MTDRQVEDLRVALAGALRHRRVRGSLARQDAPLALSPLGPEISEQVVWRFRLPTRTGETTHWTADMMAAEVGVSASAVRRIWKAHGLQPRRWRAFKLSNDPEFVAKLNVGLSSILPPTPSCCRSMRRARSRRSIALNPSCP